MSWLERLKALDSATLGSSGRCQNHQNPGSVSYGGTPAALSRATPNVIGDSWADCAAAYQLGRLRTCRACRHFAEALPAGADDLGVRGAGWCHSFSVATHPLAPLYCSRYTTRTH